MSDKKIPPSVAEYALQALKPENQRIQPVNEHPLEHPMHVLQSCLRENGEQIGMAATIAQQAELIRMQAAEIERIRHILGPVIEYAQGAGVANPGESCTLGLIESHQRQAAEIAALREIISQSADACGGYIDTACSLEFMVLLPAEIKARIAALKQAGASNLLDVSAERNALQRQLHACQSGFERECADVDRLLGLLGLPADDYRTDGGFLNIGKIFARLNASRDRVPEIMFDGNSVYQEVQRMRSGNQRTSQENVADVLDAVVALLRSAAPTPAPSHSADDGMVRVPRELLEQASIWLEIHAPGGGCVEQSVADDINALLSQTSGVGNE